MQSRNVSVAYAATSRLVLAMLLGALTLVGGLQAVPALAASVSSAVFSGAAGTVSVGGTLYAKQGAGLTLSVVTSSDTKCVEVSGAATLPRQTSTTAKSNWGFTSTAPAGNGVQAFTVAASPNFNGNGCTGQTNSTQASYTLDNTGPVVAAAITPAPNVAGWNNTDTTVKWTAADAGGSGVSAEQPFRTDSVTANGIVVLTAPAQSDRLGNLGSAGEVTVRVDKAKPTITSTETRNADGTITVSFSCADSNSGGQQSSGIASCVADGTSPASSSRTVQPGTTVTGTARDIAGNTSTESVTVAAADTTAPSITSGVTPAPNVAGWNKADATVTFSCADNEGGAGIASCVADGTSPASASRTVSVETDGTAVAGTATDKAGNKATRSVTVKVDKTAPVVVASRDRAANAAGWYGDDVTVFFACSDVLSGVASCPAPKVLGEGENQWASGSAVDLAGNTASDGVSGVNVDKTAPVLIGSFPSGWHTGDVTVDWTCTDALSGAAAQPADTAVGGEGANLTATATCADKAGNTTTRTLDGIQIDRTAPTTALGLSGAVRNGWYQSAVRVELTAEDNLAGVESIDYSLDGAAVTRYSAAFTVVDDGTHTLTYWSADKAGNVDGRTRNTVTLKVDKTPPTLSGAPTSAPNVHGWYGDDVTVSWSCSDETSGIDGTCPADTVVGGEGDGLDASASVSDNAGNSTSRTVRGLKIDRTAPTTVAELAAPPASGWHTGPVLVTLKGSDSLSGVGAIRYQLDGGATQAYDGPFSVGSDGAHEVRFWSTDRAGNVETPGASLRFHIDRTAPVTRKINPISPDSGWFVTSGIPFAFDAEDGHSGVAATYYTIDGGEPQRYGEPFVADLSTGTHSVTYWSVDAAGNGEAVRSFDINVDTVAPAIKGSQSPAPNGHGWNNTDVDVTFGCSDADSGINGVAGCAGDTRLTNDGAGQKVTGDAVDVAGNRSHTEFGPVNIDKTRPTLQGVLPAGARDGWYREDVSVQWSGDDGLSGIDPVSQPAATRVTSEGGNLSAGPVTIKDKAGNESLPASLTGVKIDRTAPVISGGPTTQQNAAGWYNKAVVVDFACTDSLSGVASCPTSKLVEDDGANQSVTSDPATDVAGNERAGKTVGGINVDGTPPTTSSNNQCTKTNGWCTGSSATVVLTAADQAGLSGVKEIRYQVDGGPVQVAPGATKSVSVSLDGSGAGSVSYWAVDNAGNAEPANSVTLKWDNIAPTVTHTLRPMPNASDWNNGEVTVHFDAKDDDAGSGIKPGSVTPDVVVSDETDGLDVVGTAEDTAGNRGSDKVTVKVDRTAPSITGAVVSGTRGADGWYTSEVTVKFTCADALSGVATCPDPMVLSSNGASSASGTATDNAGNTASATVSGIKIDQEKPLLTAADVNVAGATYTLGAVPAATCSAKDNVSGLTSCNVTVSGGNANGVGTFSYAATATDSAGNTSTVSGSYTVKYRFDGFLQPINDTAHQIGASTSVFKAGSSVPAKLQLRKSDGTLVQSTSAPSWVTPVKGSSTNAPVDESFYNLSADSGSSYRYDAVSQQYIYTWKSTSTGGNYWRIGVKLDDGQTYYVNIGLR